MSETENQLAVRRDSPVVALLKRDDVRERLAQICPPGQSVDVLLSRAKASCIANPQLQSCTPESVLLAVQKSVSCGLELNGRDSHLVPYGKTAQFLVDVKGYIKLALESGMRLVTSELVYEHDNFRRWTDDAGRHLHHAVDDRHPRGRIIGAYSYVQNASGAFDYEYMTLDEIDAIKARSRAGSGPWKTDENEMRRKTVVRRHSKRWPLGSRLAALWEHDDDRLQDIPAKAKLILPDEVMPALAAPETANLLPAISDNDGGPEEEKEHSWT